MEKGLFSNFLQKQRTKKALPYLNGRILDLGCGEGNIIKYVGNKSYVGIDINRKKVEKLSSKFHSFKFIVADLNSGQIFLKEKVDTVLMLALIEHLKDPAKIFFLLKQVMREDSLLIITTPSKLGGKIHELGAKLGLFSSEASKEHEKIYSFEEMKELLEKNGFYIELFSEFEFGLNQFFLVKRLK